MNTKSESSQTASEAQICSAGSPRRHGALAGMVVAGVAGLLLASSALAADPVDAAKLWQKSCQSCHGADGKGKTKAGEKSGVKDLTSAEIKSAYNKAKTIAAIKDGVKEKGGDKMAMKGYAEKLSAAEIEALADFTLALK